MSADGRAGSFKYTSCENSIVKSGLKCNSCINIFHRSSALKMKRCCKVEITSVIAMNPEEEESSTIETSKTCIQICEDSSNQELLLKIIHELEEKNRLLEEKSLLLKYKICKLENEIINNATKVWIKCKKIIRLDKIDVNNKTVKAPIPEIRNASAATGNRVLVIS